MPDDVLADKLYAKFYSDMPKADFYKKVGLSDGATVREKIDDAIRGAGRGAVKALGTAVTLPQDLVFMGGNYLTGQNLKPPFGSENLEKYVVDPLYGKTKTGYGRTTEDVANLTLGGGILGGGIGAVSGATSSAAGSAIRENGGTPGQQAAAYLAGGLAPSAAMLAAKNVPVMKEFLQEESNLLRTPKNPINTVNNRLDKRVVDYFTMSPSQRRVAKLLEQDPNLAERAANATDLIKLGDKYGVKLTAAEALSFGDADPLLALQAEIGGHPATGSSVAAINNARLGNLKGSYEQLADSVSPVRSADDAAGAVKQKFKEIISNLRKEKVGAADPLYKVAFGVDVPEEEIANLIKSDPNAGYFIKQASSSIDPSLRTQVFNKNPNSIAVLDAAKKLIDQSISKGDAADVRALMETKNNILALADKYSPNEYAQARAIYSSDPEFFDAISKTGFGKIANMGNLENANVPKNILADSPARTAFIADRLGEAGNGEAMASVLRSSIENNPAQDVRGLAGKLLRTDGKEAQLRELSPYATDALTDLDKIGSRINTSAAPQVDNKSSTVLSDVLRTGTNIAAGNKPAAVYGISKTLFPFQNKSSTKNISDLSDLLMSEKGIDFAKQIQNKRAEYLKLYKPK